jgi:hypothetical protein
MLTLSTVLRATNPDYVRQASKYRAEYFKIDNAKDSHGSHVRVASVIEGGSKPRKATIKCYDAKISPSSPCMVSCSCDLFQYKLEIALAARGSAKVDRAEARMPMKTNPQMLPGLCPHLAYLVKLALSSDTAKQATIKQSVKPKISPKLKKGR